MGHEGLQVMIVLRAQPLTHKSPSIQKVDPVFALVHSTLMKVGLRPWQ
jgi:hypothetical protein